MWKQLLVRLRKECKALKRASHQPPYNQDDKKLSFVEYRESSATSQRVFKQSDQQTTHEEV